MRSYDFVCECGKEFEDLVRDLSEARCPVCGSAHVTKQLSTFAIGRSSGGSGKSSPSPEMGGCGGGFCGGGGCGLN